ncbi:hypothetical protein YC2023_006778 [Brassica napus]
MANSRVFFSDLKSSKCTSVVEARLLQFWEARHVKRGGELMWVEMLPVDINFLMMICKAITVKASIALSDF